MFADHRQRSAGTSEPPSSGTWFVLVQSVRANDCSQAICLAQAEICAAHLKLEVASIRAEPVLLSNGWKIYAQSNAVNAVFARDSRSSAHVALDWSSRALYDASVSNSPLLSNCSNSSASGNITYAFQSGALQPSHGRVSAR